MRKKIEKLEHHIQELEQDIMEKNDRERLLVSYPDLHKSHNLQVIESMPDFLKIMRLLYKNVQASQ